MDLSHTVINFIGITKLFTISKLLQSHQVHEENIRNKKEAVLMRHLEGERLRRKSKKFKRTFYEVHKFSVTGI